MYCKLGKLMLDSAEGGASGGAPGGASSVTDFCAPYRDQAEALLTKVRSLEDRLSGLEQKEGGNVFTWIGNSAQTLVLRSFLTKALENLASLRRNLGERYSLRDTGRDGETGEGGVSPEINETCGEIELKQSELKVLSRDLADLREEKQQLTAVFEADGSPARKIQSLRKNIADVRDELKVLYRRAGAEAASMNAGVNAEDNCSPGYGEFIASLVLPEDRETLDKAAGIGLSIQNDEKTISRLQASLAIDEERAKIEKYRKMILEKKDRIAMAEKNIAEYEEGITDCENYIEKLRELL
jgi:chromosome segregation ATPase